MLKYKCLVLDHDETVVQSEKTMGYPFFCDTLRQIRPGVCVDLHSYVLDCHVMGFAPMCRERYGFTEEELREENLAWKQYIRNHIPDPFPGIDQVILRQKEAGGLVCVVSHSHKDTIVRDYQVHFGINPDAVYGYELPEHMRKPNPYPLTDIMQRFSLQPKDLLVVDDAKLAWDMAEPLGVDTAFAAWSKEEFPTVLQQMRSLCTYSFDSTQELEKFLFE